MNRFVAALQTDDLHPLGALDVTGALWIVGATAATLMALLVVAIVVLSRPANKRVAPAPSGAHVSAGDRQRWMARVDDVVARHDAHEIGADEAYAELAALTRAFAGAHSGRDLDASTLRELRREPRTGRVSNWDRLKTTIAALYPPEFADASSHPAAREADVRSAADWVCDFMERWR